MEERNEMSERDLAEDRKKFEQELAEELGWESVTHRPSGIGVGDTVLFRKPGGTACFHESDLTYAIWNALVSARIAAYQAGLKEAGRARPLGKTPLCMSGHLSSSHHLGKECLGAFYPNFSGGGGWTGCQCKRFESDAGDALVAQTPDVTENIICDGCHFSFPTRGLNSLYCIRCERMRAHLATLAPTKPSVMIDIYQHDWMPGFASFRDDGEIEENAKAHVSLNIGSLLSAVQTKDLDAADLPYMVAECLMHEVIHVLEAWARVEFSEERVEALLTKYREKYQRATIWEYTGNPPGVAQTPPQPVRDDKFWNIVHPLLEQWQQVWRGDRAKYATQYPAWILDASAELFAHDMCDAWSWNDYVSAAATIIARHAPASGAGQRPQPEPEKKD